MRKNIKFLLLPFTILVWWLNGSGVQARESLVLNVVEDTNIDSIRFYHDHSQFSKLLIGFRSTDQNGTGIIFLKYEIDGLFEEGGEFDLGQIERVELLMYQYRNRFFVPFEVVVTQPLGDWSAQSTSWINHPELDPAFTQSQIIQPVFGWTSFDITSVFLTQISDWENSYGLVIRHVEEEGFGADFWSIDCLVSQQTPHCSTPLFPHILVTFKEEVVEPEEEPETEPEDESEVEPEEEDALEDEEVSEDETTDPEQKVEEEKEVEVLVLEKPEIDEKIEIRQEKVEEEIEEPPFIPEIFLSNLDIESSSGKQGALAEQGDVLGAKDSSEKLGYCRYRFNMTLEIIVRERCKMDNPVVSRIDHPLAEKIHWIDVEVTVAQTMDAYFQIVKCKKWELFDLKTWFGKCSEEVVEEYSERVNGEITIYNSSSGRDMKGFQTDLGSGKYKVNFLVGEDMSAKYFRARYLFDFDVKVPRNGKQYIFREVSPMSDKVRIPQLRLTSSADLKPLIFPFGKSVGVTQWYGHTQYQSPHTGVDFGAKKEPVLATGDGRVIYAGWDNGKNKCLSGGNYILVEHKDGLHTLYLHLDSFKDSSGIALKAGDRVYKGQQIGISGNSGLYNCEPLGYHLHFETRKSREYGSHTDPVPLVNTDWSKVPTLGYATYPGRLSGQNPHPGK